MFVVGGIISPPKTYVEILILGTYEDELIWKRLFEDIIKMRYYWMRMDPYKMRDIWTQMHRKENTVG